MLFLSRLNPKKGLDVLVEAWKVLWESNPDWILDIAGPDEDGYGAALALHAAQCGIPETSIRFHSPQFGEAKWRLYQNAELFVLPSHSENFGNVIAEALAQGVPVLTTKGTPWQILEEQACGWWIDIGLAPLLAQLQDVLKLPPDGLREMGARGQALTKAKFDWDALTKELQDCYRWMIDRKLPPPSCVRLD